MKFLLAALNAKYIHSNPALYSLRAYAEKYHPEAAAQVELAEYTINQTVEEILADLYERKPEAVAFSCYIWNWKMMQEVISELHQVRPELPIWLGGPEVSYHAEEVLEQFPFLTGIMVGEGEVTFSELLTFYEKKSSGRYSEQQQLQIVAFWPGAIKQAGLDSIAGIVYRDPITGELVRTKERSLTNISEIPFFYKDMKDFANRIVYYESSRGCPFRCGYAMEIWKYIQENDNGITNFHFEISADLLNGEELALLAKMRPGLVQLEIGVQSTNLQTLEAVRRHTNQDKLRHAVVRIHSEYNIHVHLDLIAGLPYEDMGSFIRSFNDVYSMRPQQLQLGFLKVLKGSYLEEMAQTYGIVYQSCPPYEVLYTKWLSYGDIIRLKRVEEMVELYYNSNQFTHLIPVLQSRFENSFAMYDKLADFYHEKGYFVHTPARAYRYQVLLEFAQQEDPDGMELYRELAVYDLYLRENAKSRPAFALDEKPYHDQIVEFYQEEEKNRAYLPGYEEYHARQLQRMTHLEVFSWPVQKKAWELISMLKRGEVPETETAILFDYQNRDRLTDNARTAVVELPTAADAKPTAGQTTAVDAESVAGTGKGAVD